MGAVMEKAKPNLKSFLKTCIRNEAASLSVQKAAIQAFRKMTITEEVNWVTRTSINCLQFTLTVHRSY